MNTEVPKDLSLNDLISKIQSYFSDADVDAVKKAFEFSKSRHDGQTRSSGEAYITHPLSVAYILATLRLDLASIITGILHDTVEDTSASRDEIKDEFGEEIAFLVDGVTKLGKLKFKSSHEKQAENFRKMLLAMGQRLTSDFGQTRWSHAQHEDLDSSSTSQTTKDCSRNARYLRTVSQSFGNLVDEGRARRLRA